MRFVDTDIFLRFLVQPASLLDQEKAESCRALFERAAAGEEVITTSEAVLAEVVYVLASPRQYGLAPVEVSGRLKPLIGLPGLKLSQKRLYLRALDIYSANAHLDFEDAISAAIVERMESSEIYSYDRDFDRLETVTRIEPAESR